MRRKILVVASRLCNGCRRCEMYCSLRFCGGCNPFYSRIRIIRLEGDNGYAPVICRQCSNPPCQAACPVGAIKTNPKIDAFEIDEALCIGCAICIDACPIGAISIDPTDTIIMCDLCHGDPLCVKFCHDRAIQYVDRVNVSQERRFSMGKAPEG
ncbi:MAG: 4Fe-4S dicluster domain-containing protein [Dehalococcoidia bacterium]